MSDLLANSYENKKTSSPVKRVWRWWLNLLVTFILWILFHTVTNLSLRKTRWLAKKFGRLMELVFMRRLCKVVDANLAIAFPDKTADERLEIRHKNIAFLVEFFLDFLSMLHNPSWTDGRVVVPPLPPELDLRDEPVVWGISHFGNWEVLSQAFPLTGHPKNAAIAADFTLEVLNRLITRCRTRYGVEMIPQQGASRGLIEKLRQGYFVGIAIDQNVSPRHGGIFVDFFGLPAPSSRLQASVARRMNCKIAMIFCNKREDGKFEFHYLTLPHPTDWYESDEQLTEEILRQDEEFIRKYPEQYLWCYKRWKYMPTDGSEDLQSHYPFYALDKKYTMNRN